MIIEARPMPGKTWSECVFKNGSMPNEVYHAQPGISSSGLATIISDCLAAYKYADPDDLPQRVLEFGTASHAALLEQATFEANFYRDISEDDEGVVGSDRGCDSAVKALLKEMGVPKYSTLSGDELYALALQADPNMKILCVERKKLADANQGKTAVRPADWDKLMKMRRVMMAHPEFKHILAAENMFFETSIFCQVKVQGCDDWIDVKIRPDVITKSRLVPDYKTTGRSTSPATAFGFERHAIGMMYHVRMWFICDVLSAIYGGDPFKPTLLAQCTVTPFIPAHFELDHPAVQWDARRKYTEGLVMYANAIKTGKWPAPYSRTQQLMPPHWMIEEFNSATETKE